MRSESGGRSWAPRGRGADHRRGVRARLPAGWRERDRRGPGRRLPLRRRPVDRGRRAGWRVPGARRGARRRARPRLSARPPRAVHQRRTAGRASPLWPVTSRKPPRSPRLAVATAPAEVVFALVGRRAPGKHGRRPALAAARRGSAGVPLDTVALDPAAPDRLWAAGADRIWRSDDLGSTWRAVGQPLPEPGTQVRGIAADPAATTLVVTTARGMYRSADGGAHLGAQGRQSADPPRGRASDSRPGRCAHPLCGLLADAVLRGLAHRARGQQPARPGRPGQPRRRRRLPAAADDRRRPSGPLARPPAHRTSRRGPPACHEPQASPAHRRWSRALGLAVLAGAAAALLPGVWSRARFVEYPMAQSEHMPVAVAAAADGTVWFTIDGAAAIGRVRDGRRRAAAEAGQEHRAARTCRGARWQRLVHRHRGQQQVSRMTPSGAVSSVPIDTPIVRLGRLAVAPDGAVWFAEATELQHQPGQGWRAHPATRSSRYSAAPTGSR